MLYIPQLLTLKGGKVIRLHSLTVVYIHTVTRCQNMNPIRGATKHTEMYAKLPLGRIYTKDVSYILEVSCCGSLAYISVCFVAPRIGSIF